MNRVQPGILALLGPSGVGKSVTRALLEQYDGRFTAISTWTTRPPRQRERDRIHVSDADFDARYSPDRFLPARRVFGARYATPTAPIHAALRAERFPVLDWPVDLLADLKESFPGRILSVYLRPPTASDHARRLAEDGRDPTGDRMREGAREIESLPSLLQTNLVDMVVAAERDREDEVMKIIHAGFLMVSRRSLDERLCLTRASELAMAYS